MVFRGSDVGSSIIKDGHDFLVYGDPDIDGMIAAYLVCAYLRRRGTDFSYYINENRQHGFFIPYERVRGKTIIAVDFSMTAYEIKQVVDAGADIVLIDHHTIGSEFIDYSNGANRGIVINNQYSFEDPSQRFLSGAGVVFHFLGYLDNGMLNDENKALVGITLLSDIREIENKYAREFLGVTYNSNAPMIKRLINITAPDYDFGFGVIRMDRNYIDYTFSPKFNALFRANMGYEAFEFMLGKPLSKALITECREFQNAVVTYMLSHLHITKYSNITYAYIEHTDMCEVLRKTQSSEKFLNCLLSNYIGLVCSRIKGCGNAVVYIKNGDLIERGSFRGTLDNVDYLRLFKDLGAVADGHKNAFGFSKFVANDKAELNDILKIIEDNASKTTHSNIVEVRNLSVFERGSAKDIANYNIYARSHKMVYLRYIGNIANCKCDISGKLYKWVIDGVVVKSFSPDITPENGLILPIKERGYMAYYLREGIN